MSQIPWTQEQRAAKVRKMNKESERMAAKLGVKGVYVIAFFDAGDGEHYHILDAGKAPMSYEDLHKLMLSSIERLKITGEGYTQ